MAALDTWRTAGRSSVTEGSLCSSTVTPVTRSMDTTVAAVCRETGLRNPQSVLVSVMKYVSIGS